MNARHHDIVLIGLGNIGLGFLRILRRKAKHLRDRYGLHFRVTGAADSKGAALDPGGLDLERVIRLKEERHTIAAYPGRGQPGMAPLDLVERTNAQVLCEASPVNLEDGEPGLSCIRRALEKKMHVVTPNKGPLVLAYGELVSLAAAHQVQLLFCGAVAGGLPAINIGRRDLAGATIYRIEALPNLTTSLILDLMSQGMSYDQALAAAQRQGCAEADPSLDVEGWDAANKLVILANSVLGVPATLDQVQVQGITGITQDDLSAAASAGQVIKLLATAARQDDGAYALTVAPTPLPGDHPLAQLGGHHMGIVYQTDIYGAISANIREDEPIPSAATILRDLLTIYIQQ
jgi:homoserine dehydrogenase